MMTRTKQDRSIAAHKTLKRTGLSGIGIGVLTLIACELPLILTVVGLGGLGASAKVFQPPLIIEIAAVGLFILGAAIIAALAAKRYRVNRNME